MIVVYTVIAEKPRKIKLQTKLHAFFHCIEKKPTSAVDSSGTHTLESNNIV